MRLRGYGSLVALGGGILVLCACATLLGIPALVNLHSDVGLMLAAILAILVITVLVTLGWFIFSTINPTQGE
jgi:hypothetical protein